MDHRERVVVSVAARATTQESRQLFPVDMPFVNPHHAHSDRPILHRFGAPHSQREQRQIIVGGTLATLAIPAFTLSPGLNGHAVDVLGRGPEPMSLLLCHGWLSRFVEF
jgi:hypothetical protein